MVLYVHTKKRQGKYLILEARPYSCGIYAAFELATVPLGCLPATIASPHLSPQGGCARGPARSLRGMSLLPVCFLVSVWILLDDELSVS